MQTAEKLEQPEWVSQYWEDGYIKISGVLKKNEIKELDTSFQEILKLQEQPARHTQFHYTEVAEEKRLFLVKWPSEVHQRLNHYRLHPNLVGPVQEILGTDLRQIVNQLHFKFPGDGVNFPFHQDCVFRLPEKNYEDLYHSFVQTALSVDPSNQENGCLIFFPKSHIKKKSLLSYDGDPSTFNDQNETGLQKLGEPIYCESEPGDLVIWNPYMVHGSKPNLSKKSRRMYINGFCKTDSTPHGMEVTRGGQNLPIDLISNLLWDQVTPYSKLD